MVRNCLDDSFFSLDRQRDRTCMAPQASKKCGLLPPDHQQIGCCACNRLNSEQVLGTFSVLKISSLAPEVSAQRESRFLTPVLFFETP